MASTISGLQSHGPQTTVYGPHFLRKFTAEGRPTVYKAKLKDTIGQKLSEISQDKVLGKNGCAQFTIEAEGTLTTCSISLPVYI